MTEIELIKNLKKEGCSIAEIMRITGKTRVEITYNLKWDSKMEEYPFLDPINDRDLYMPCLRLSVNTVDDFLALDINTIINGIGCGKDTAIKILEVQQRLLKNNCRIMNRKGRKELIYETKHNRE